MKKFLNRQSELLLYRVMPHLVLEGLRQYFRVEVEGVEHLPTRGAGIISPNHSGYSGFDALILSHEIFKSTSRIPRIMTHHLWFTSKTMAHLAQKMGFAEATIKNGESLLKKNNLVTIFPEGEFGNFKSTRRAYKLQEFKRGFIRLALLTRSPIIPTLIIGAEETHINLKQLKFKGMILPLPLNILPLPAKWKIIFLEPIELPYHADAVEDSELMRELAQDVRERMQNRLNRELAQREYIYFKKLI